MFLFVFRQSVHFSFKKKTKLVAYRLFRNPASSPSNAFCEQKNSLVIYVKWAVLPPNENSSESLYAESKRKELLSIKCFLQLNFIA